MLATIDRMIASESEALAVETARIAKLVADRQIGEDSGHWKPRHRIAARLAALRALHEALGEAAG
jgi:hypothetical protein